MVAIAGASYKAYHLGANNVRAEYAARDLQAAAEAQAAYKAVAEKYRAKEQADAQALAQVANDYERRLKDAKSKTSIALDAIRSGSLKLRDPGTASNQAGRDCPAQTTASAVVGDGSTGAELSRDASAFLYSEAARADAYTEQLGACQAALEADRR